jgi:hypothetical protein
VLNVQHGSVSESRRAQLAPCPDASHPGCRPWPSGLAKLPTRAAERQSGGQAAHPSRYYASVSTSPRPEAVRRQQRWAIRAVASQDPDTAERQRKCGVVTLGAGVQIRVKDGAYFCGLTTCGSVWLCTVCSAKIRATRADELVRGLDAHYDAGGAVHLLTMTVAHDRADRLRRLLGVEAAGWKLITNGGAWTRLKRATGLAGWVRAVEITEGDEHGWHPHFHILILTDAELDAAGLAALKLHMTSRWSKACEAAGLRPPHPVHGVDFRPNIARLGDELARYCAKVQEWGVEQEITRGDLKSGRSRSRVPFEILRDYQERGELEDRDLWFEYVRAVKGLSAIRWSRGLKPRLLPGDDEKSDDEAAQIEANGELLGEMTVHVWRRVVIARLEIAVLEAAEDGGLEAVNVLLAAHGCGWATPVISSSCTEPVHSTTP